MLGALTTIARELIRVGPTVLPLVVDLVRTIARSQDPRLTAERALKAAASEQGAEQLIHAQYGR